MPLSIYAASVPVFQQLLNSLKQILQKAETQAAERKFDPQALLQARLYPDMFPLIRQVQIAADFAKGASARLAGVEVPSFEDSEQSFAELQARLDKTLAFIGSLNEAQFAEAGTRAIVLNAGTARERQFVGQIYLLHYALPHFYFHVATAYDLLRHNGIEIGKTDFIGAVPQL